MPPIHQPASIEDWIANVIRELKHTDSPIAEVLWQRLLTASQRLHYERGGDNWDVTGPSSSHTPYVVPLASHVSTHAILTTGDAVGEKLDPPSQAGEPYRMAGIPDGLGAYDNANGTFTVLMNHEIGADDGVERAHGSKGAFVSKLVVDKETLKVLDADDLVQRVYTYDTESGQYQLGTTAFARLCSASLGENSAFYDAATQEGYNGLIYLTGEEVGVTETNPEGGRAFAHLATGSLEGTSYELAAFGNAAWENLVAHAHTGEKTVVIAVDDSTPGQVYLYAGEKQASGTPIERAGLEGGALYGIQVLNASGQAAHEDRQTGFGAESTRFNLAAVGDMTGKNGAELEAASDANQVTEFLRPEDGEWDTVDPDRFYFVTTDRFNEDKLDGSDDNDGADDGRTRLWSLTFDDVTQPEQGGTIEMLLDGTGPYQMFDNITVNSRGQVLLQEDPGGNNYNAKIWQYDPQTDDLKLLAQHDPERFGDIGKEPTPPFNNNEESSGIIDVTGIVGQPGKDVYLLDVQAHYSVDDPELVQGGQLLAMQVDVIGQATQASDHHFI